MAFMIVHPWFRKVFSCFMTGILLLACRSAENPTLNQFADRILYNGKIITVDASDTMVESLAVKDGIIAASGPFEQLRDLVGPNTEMIDLKGNSATPGLLDAHCHFQEGGVDLLYEIDLSYPNVKSVADVVALVRQQAATVGEGEWILGRGWDEGKFEENRYIYASDLDEAAPGNPVWLTHTMGHYGTANRKALEMAEINRSTSDPAGGTIDRDSQGQPTGVLKESAQNLVGDLIPETTRQQREEGLRHIVREFNREGMTGLKDPGIGTVQWETYRKIRDAGDLTVRVFALWRPGTTLSMAQDLLQRVGSFTKPPNSSGEDHLISGGIKLAIDGSGGARTAWLYQDWNKNFTEEDTGNRGYPTTDPEILRQQIRLFHEAGLHVSVHSIGDRAIDWVVDSFALVLEEKPAFGLRHGIIHSNIPTDHALETMARLQKEYDAGYPEPSASFTWWIGDTYAGNFGPERAHRLNPFKTYLKNDILWADGSDFSVTPFPARYGLWASMARQTLLGVYGAHPYGQEESVDFTTALRSRTIWAARQMFLEDKIGSLEVGKYADIAVWDRDLSQANLDEIKEMKCVMTLFSGDIVYHAEKEL